MNVHDPPTKCLKHWLLDDAHIAGEHDEVHTGFLQESDGFLFQCWFQLGFELALADKVSRDPSFAGALQNQGIGPVAQNHHDLTGNAATSDRFHDRVAVAAGTGAENANAYALFCHAVLLCDEHRKDKRAVRPGGLPTPRMSPANAVGETRPIPVFAALLSQCGARVSVHHERHHPVADAFFAKKHSIIGAETENGLRCFDSAHDIFIRSARLDHRDDISLRHRHGAGHCGATGHQQECGHGDQKCFHYSENLTDLSAPGKFQERVAIAF